MPRPATRRIPSAMLWRRRIEPLARPFFQAHARATRGLTMGVRGLVQDEGGRVLLVEHTYLPGWYLPGGGVERGETAQEAVTRELVEETGVVVSGALELAGLYYSGPRFPSDHVLMFRATAWRQEAATQRGEIHTVGWFAPDNLPPDASPSTRALLDGWRAAPISALP